LALAGWNVQRMTRVNKPRWVKTARTPCMETWRSLTQWNPITKRSTLGVCITTSLTKWCLYFSFYWISLKFFWKKRSRWRYLWAGEMRVNPVNWKIGNQIASMASTSSHLEH
jgi:hypothetical protein